MQTRGWPDGDNLFKEPAICPLVKRESTSSEKRFSGTRWADIPNARGAKNTATIQFDGGTSRHGDGVAYGSWKINNFAVVSRSFGGVMSSNAAEVWTLIFALNEAANIFVPSETAIFIEGDSQVALRQCIKTPRNSPKSSAMFVRGCEKVFALCGAFHSVQTKWRPRRLSVRVFGH